MARAVALARRGEGHTRPNPPVGAVVALAGKKIGEGWHRRCGGDHAEVAALKDALRRVGSVKGATVYVTLEPCSRPGRVGACTDALIAAGVGRVVFACRDPNPVNRGRARRILARAGIVCEMFRSLDAEMLLAPFAKHVTSGLPFVSVKIAMSLDGRICDDSGAARWISSAAARRTTGRMRNRVDAIMVGAGTLRADDPLLLPHEGRNDDLLRVIVTRSGKIPSDARVFTDGRNETAVFKIGSHGGCGGGVLPAVDLKDMLVQLGRRGIMHVLCEGGMELAVSLAEAGLVDEWIAVLSPCVIGSRPVAEKRRFIPVGGGHIVRAGEDTIARFSCLPD
jgi:diaminohydroxyphosphoribosylaminopyrimidine deaminase/5-amino-6-(5-phosphoribosylamino)uracil reductase